MLLILLISQTGFIIFYFSVIQPELTKDHCDSHYSSFFAATDYSNMAISSPGERPVQVQMFEGFAISGLLQFFSRSIPPSRQIHLVFGNFVKIFRLSPAYILNRTILI
jgi:hypothetical protein